MNSLEFCCSLKWPQYLSMGQSICIHNMKMGQFINIYIIFKMGPHRLLCELQLNLTPSFYMLCNDSYNMGLQ